MSGYLLDTNHASKAMADNSALRPKLVEAAKRGSIYLPMPVVGELWFMVFNSTRIQDNQRRLERLLQLCAISPFGSACALEFGRIRAELRRLGRPIPPIDAQIAAIARVNSLTVLSADAHFLYVPNLQVENWLQP